MSIAANQQRTFLRLIAQLRPHWRRDPALPARIQSVLAAHREFGSRDRRLYRELIYTTLRYLPWIEPLLDPQPEEAVRRLAWLAADLPTTKLFRATFATGDLSSGNKAGLLPAWFRTHCPEIFSGQELETQLRRAPLWLRLQAEEADQPGILEEFNARGWPWRRSDVLADAVELRSEADVTKSDAWSKGRIEVQDLGSQMILESVGINAGEHWLDACAGAGGKTLQLARLLGSSGRIDAHDVRPKALAELRSRASRGGIVCHPLDDNTSAGISRRRADDCHPMDDNGAAPIRLLPRVAAGVFYDSVLVDAPCSGSGTWRRAPHLKWVTTEAQIAQAAEKQGALLHQFSQCVRPGGRLIYATCSLSSRENEDVVAGFLADHREFQMEPFARIFGAHRRDSGLTLFPSLHDTDGFFVASLRRR